MAKSALFCKLIKICKKSPSAGTLPPTSQRSPAVGGDALKTPVCCFKLLFKKKLSYPALSLLSVRLLSSSPKLKITFSMFT